MALSKWRGVAAGMSCAIRMKCFSHEIFTISNPQFCKDEYAMCTVSSVYILLQNNAQS